jgi:hypothetical protein
VGGRSTLDGHNTNNRFSELGGIGWGEIVSNDNESARLRKVKSHRNTRDMSGYPASQILEINQPFFKGCITGKYFTELIDCVDKRRSCVPTGINLCPCGLKEVLVLKQHFECLEDFSAGVTGPNGKLVQVGGNCRDCTF